MKQTPVTFPAKILKLGDLADFKTSGSSPRPPYFSKRKEFELRTEFLLKTDHDPAFNAKTYLRNKYIDWMVASLAENTQVHEDTPIHWYTGVYGIFHIVCDPQSGLVHYLYIGSGDVEANLIQNRKIAALHHDSNCPADLMARKLGISGESRYKGKVYEIYDVVGPQSCSRAGPFNLSMGYERHGVSFNLRTDGYLTEKGVDDSSEIQITADS